MVERRRAGWPAHESRRIREPAVRLISSASADGAAATGDPEADEHEARDRAADREERVEPVLRTVGLDLRARLDRRVAVAVLVDLHARRDRRLGALDVRALVGHRRSRRRAVGPLGLVAREVLAHVDDGRRRRDEGAVLGVEHQAGQLHVEPVDLERHHVAVVLREERRRGEVLTGLQRELEGVGDTVDGDDEVETDLSVGGRVVERRGHLGEAGLLAVDDLALLGEVGLRVVDRALLTGVRRERELLRGRRAVLPHRVALERGGAGAPVGALAPVDLLGVLGEGVLPGDVVGHADGVAQVGGRGRTRDLDLGGRRGVALRHRERLDRDRVVVVLDRRVVRDDADLVVGARCQRDGDGV